MADVWQDLEARLTEINALSMPRNAAIAKARSSVQDVRAAAVGTIEAVDIKGPATLLRVVGSANRVYGGEWWFEESLLTRLDQAYSRVAFGSEKTQAVRAILREALALSATWNRMTEIWALEIPAAQAVSAYQSQAAGQALFHGLPFSGSTVNRMLVGGAKQFFVPVKNPLWVTRYGTLS
jgi:hypothetical protein